LKSRKKEGEGHKGEGCLTFRVVPLSQKKKEKGRGWEEEPRARKRRSSSFFGEKKKVGTRKSKGKTESPKKSLLQKEGKGKKRGREGRRGYFRFSFFCFHSGREKKEKKRNKKNTCSQLPSCIATDARKEGGKEKEKKRGKRGGKKVQDRGMQKAVHVPSKEETKRQNGKG